MTNAGKVRTRLAPSPTGFLHVGTARTALFNYLFAKKYGGEFILRIENTDLERSDPRYEKDILQGLEWLGIATDESPLKSGLYGPYRQSERTELYKKYILDLLQKGRAFYCFHSETELKTEKEKLLEAKKPLSHICEYRNMGPAEAETLKEAKKSYIIRFKTPAGQQINFTDLIRGELVFDSSLLGDFSVAKDTSIPLYNFAVVVDDYEMKISHVIRGEDHISNTPKQILLLEALSFTKPQYAHLPLILGPDRSKLSKRHGATSLNEYQKTGYLPEAIFNFMALLGWSLDGSREIFSREELIKEFSLEKVQKAGAIFDFQKLDWMNGEYIRKKSVIELTELCKPFLQDFLQFFPKPSLTVGIPVTENDLGTISNSQFSKEYIEKIIALEQPRLKKLSEIGERTEYFFRIPEYPKDLLRWKEMTDKEVLSALEHAEKIISNLQFTIFKKGDIEKAFLKEIGAGDKGIILWPLRVALSGKKASPGPFEIMEILGIEESLKHLKSAKEILRGSTS